jgi:plastocyanin
MRLSRSSPRNVPVLAVALAFLLAGCGSSSDDPIGPPPGNGNGNGNGTAEAGDVTGTVSHADFGVGQVQLTLRDGPGDDRDLTTSNDGTFTFEDVEPGSWELEIAPPGYFELAQGEDAVRSVQVPEGGSVTVNVSLSPTQAGDTRIIEATTGLTFSPASTNISPGTVVRWVNESSVLHTVTPDGHSAWSEGSMPGSGDTFEIVINNPGEYDYVCVPHQGDGMVGTVTVVP